MTYAQRRLAEIKTEKRGRRIVRSRPFVTGKPRGRPPKPVPANSQSLIHIAARLRSAGMVNFADVIERAAAKLAAIE